MKREFKNLCRISGLMCLALLFSSCSQENMKPDDGGNEGGNDGEQTEDEARLPEIHLQFAAISGVGEDGKPVGKSVWEAQDKVKAFVVPSDAASITDWTEYQHEYATDAENCKTGSFIPSEKHELGKDMAYDWYVMYPHHAKVVDPLGGTDSQTRFSMNGQVQDNVHPSAHLAAYDIMTATASQVKSSAAPEFMMEHKCAMMKFNVVNNAKKRSIAVKKIDFVAPEGVAISGTFSIDFAKRGALTGKKVSNSALLGFKEPLSLNAGEDADVYLMMPPFKLKSGDVFTYRFITEEGVVEKNVTVDKDLDIVPGSLNEFRVNIFSDIPRQIQLTSNELFMKKGQTIRMEAKVTPDDGTEPRILWSTDHPEIAGVEDFIDYVDIRSFSAGKATITARIENEEAEATCDIYVTMLDKYKLALKVGETSQFKLVNIPESSGVAVWQSNAPEVVSVDQNGNVTALKQGYAEITVNLGETKMFLTGSVTVCPDDVEMETIMLGDIQIPMVKVEAGTFKMGATWDQGEDARDKEKPAHQVTLTKDYYVGMFEVTQEIWNAVMDTIPCHYEGHIGFPVEHITWNEIIDEFLPKLNKMTGKNFTLPTEAQWEFAARGGNRTQNYRYSGSNVADEVAWFEDNSKEEIENPDENHDSFEGTYHPHNVGMKLPNELGIYDMSGNVFEWCLDWYGGYSANAQTDPTGPETAKAKVLRGGSFDFEADRCRVAFRDSYYPYYWHFRYGFRLALNTL